MKNLLMVGAVPFGFFLVNTRNLALISKQLTAAKASQFALAEPTKNPNPDWFYRADYYALPPEYKTRFDYAMEYKSYCGAMSYRNYDGALIKTIPVNGNRQEYVEVRKLALLSCLEMGVPNEALRSAYDGPAFQVGAFLLVGGLVLGFVTLMCASPTVRYGVIGSEFNSTLGVVGAVWGSTKETGHYSMQTKVAAGLSAAAIIAGATTILVASSSLPLTRAATREDLASTTQLRVNFAKLLEELCRAGQCSSTARL